ncbi:MAG: hypothetical protein K2Y23_26570 [Cyanobacteria bacterium]|nr:hypothetical protein [Cyanobacteriota bacterium]
MRYFFALARARVDEDTALTAIALVAAYPFAVFFSAAYTESLFLLCTIAACYHFERDRLMAAGVWGLAAGLTRPPGCLLSIVLALIALRQFNTSPLSRLAQRMAAAAMPGIGMLIYSAYIYSLTGNPLQWAEQHGAWGREYKGLITLVIAALAIHRRQRALRLRHRPDRRFDQPAARCVRVDHGGAGVAPFWTALRRARPDQRDGAAARRRHAVAGPHHVRVVPVVPVAERGAPAAATDGLIGGLCDAADSPGRRVLHLAPALLIA